MNKGRNPARMRLLWRVFGARFAPRSGEKQAGTAGNCSQVPGQGNTHLKVLKIKRLQAFQDDSKFALFSAGSELAEIGNTLGHRARTVGAYGGTKIAREHLT